MNTNLKNKKRINIGEEEWYDASYSAEHTPIDELIQYLKEAKESGATLLDWYASSSDGDSDYVQVQPFCEREETDEEVALRLKNESDIEAVFLANEKQKYLLLKAKFEP